MAKKRKKKSPATSATLAEAIRQEHNLSTNESKEIVRTLLRVVEEALKDDRDVLLNRIGTLRIVSQGKKVAFNPKKKEHILLSERKLLKFETSRVIMDEINQDNPRTYTSLSEEEARKLSKTYSD